MVAGQDRNLATFAAIWLRCWLAAGGLIGMLDRRRVLGLSEPHDEAAVRSLERLRDSTPGHREAIKAELSKVLFLPILE